LTLFAMGDAPCDPVRANLGRETNNADAARDLPQS